MFDWVRYRPPKILKFSKWSYVAANHRDCYNAQRFLVFSLKIDVFFKSFSFEVAIISSLNLVVYILQMVFKVWVRLNRQF